MLKYIIKKLSRNMESYDINIDELKEKQKKGAKIIDVRSTQEYDEWHLDGAINIPYYEINPNRCKDLPNIEIVVYCEKGSRSKKAYKLLKKLGYTKLYNLYGGLNNWI